MDDVLKWKLLVLVRFGDLCYVKMVMLFGQIWAFRIQ